MEVYSHGMRNIYDVAIDPYMNIFTRGNTNAVSYTHLDVYKRQILHSKITLNCPLSIVH